MARHQYVILTQAQPGRDSEFERWYDEQHLGDVCKVDGVVRATRYRIDEQKVTGLEAPHWLSLAVYEIESDDPKSVMDAIAAAAGTSAMPLSEALSQAGMVQLLAHEVAVSG